MTRHRRLALMLAGLLLLAFVAPMSASAQENTTDKYTEDEVLEASKQFFGDTSKDLATIIEKIFKDQGEPNAYITGEEAAGAIAVGLRYGNGWLHHKAGGTRRLFWQGPSLGFDLGGNASKVFTLVYNLGGTNEVGKYSDVEDSGLGMRFRNTAGGLSNVQWYRLLKHTGDQYGEGDRRDGVLYISPEFAGFTVSAAWGTDDGWDSALR